MNNYFEIKERFNNKNGYTLVGVLMVVLILSILGISIFTVTISTLKVTSVERNNQSAFYIAEAGLTYELSKIENMISNNSDVKDEDFVHPFARSNLTFENVPGAKNNPIAEVEVKSLGGNNYVITSKGTIDEESRILEQKFSITLADENDEELVELPKGIVVFTIGSTGRQGNIMKLSQGNIEGKLGTLNGKSNSIHFFNGVTFNDQIYVPKSAHNNIVSVNGNSNARFELVRTDFVKVPTLPEFPEFPKGYKEENLPYIGNGRSYTLDMHENLDLGDVKISGYQSLNIDTNGNDREIVINDLHLDGHINVIGNGDLTIYIRGTINLTNGSINNNSDSNSRVAIFLEGDSKKQKVFDTGYNMQAINASIYAKDADIIIRNGAMFGSIFSGGDRFEVYNGPWFPTPVLYFAPNAEFVHSNGKITGTIIANNYDMSNGANVEYQPVDPSSYSLLTGEKNNTNGTGNELIKEPLSEK